MARENNASDRLGVMPVNKLVFSISLPVIISMLVQAMYNIVDSAFVGSYGDMPLRALSLAFPVEFIYSMCSWFRCRYQCTCCKIFRKKKQTKGKQYC